MLVRVYSLLEVKVKKQEDVPVRVKAEVAAGAAAHSWDIDALGHAAAAVDDDTAAAAAEEVPLRQLRTVCVCVCACCARRQAIGSSPH